MKRKKWADIAKSFAIIGVLVGHTPGIPGFLARFIYSFHMPLFFILSGYFMKDTEDIKKSVKKDAKGMLIPYAVTCVIIIFLAAVLAFLKDQDVLTPVKQWTIAALYGSGGPVAVPKIKWIGALWFLLALFFAKLIIYLTEALGKYQWAAVFAIAYIGYATARLFWLPMSIQAGMTASMYVYIGKIIHKNDLFTKSFCSGKTALYIFAPALWAFCVMFCGRLYMVENFYGNGLLDIFGSIAATFTLVWLSMLIEKYIPIVKNVLAYIGSITLVILCAHITELNVFPWPALVRILRIKWTWWIELSIRFVLVALMCAVLRVIPVINRVYFPKRKKRAAAASA